MDELETKYPHIFNNEFNTRFIRKKYKSGNDTVYILKDENCRLDVIKKTSDNFVILDKTDTEFWLLLTKPTSKYFHVNR